MIWHKSFRLRIILLTIFILLTMITTFFAININIVKSNLEKYVYERNQNASIMIKESLDVYFSSLKENMMNLSNVENIKKFDLEESDLLLKQVVNTNESVNQIFLINKKGIQFYKTSHIDTLGSRKDRKYFQVAIEGESFISDIIWSRSTNKPITVISVPIYNKNEIVGVLGASIDLEKINQIVKESNIEDRRNTYIVDSSGKLIINSKEDSNSKISFWEPLEKIDLNKSSINKYIYDSEERLIVYSDLNQARWKIFVETPVKIAFKDINIIIRRFIILFISIIIIAIIVVTISSKILMKPIMDIVNSINNIKINRKSEVFKNIREDEFGFIQKAFKELMDEMNNAYDILEEKVDLRTKELQNRNKKIKDTLNQLKSTQEKLIESEKNLALGRIGIRIAHELNTPLGTSLTTINYFSNKLEEIVKKHNNGKIDKKLFNRDIKKLRDSVSLIKEQLKEAIKIIE